MSNQNTEVRLNRFRNEVRVLIEPQFPESLAFWQAVERKCHSWRNCYEPCEVISIAYLVGQKLILQGVENPLINTRAWMLSTILNILRTQKRTNNKEQEQCTSINLNISTRNSNKSFFLEEVIASKEDPHNPYFLADIKDRERKNKLAVQAFKTLSENEQTILKLRVIEEHSWAKIAQILNFAKGQSTLRQKGRRTLNNLRKEFNKLVTQDEQGV